MVETNTPLDDPAVIVATSGSTAIPKLVPNTHRNLWASADAAARGQSLGPDDRSLALGSVAHVLGIRAITDALWCGGSAVVPEAVTVDAIAAALFEHRPTCVIASPPLLNVLASALESLTDDERDEVAASLRFVRSGAAALRPAVSSRLRVLIDARVLHGYGMSEVAKIACETLGERAPKGSVGKPLGVEVRLDDGEIVVRGACVAPGYFDDAHESASAFEDGWFRTGDVGRLDHDGNLFLLGRKDDVVSRGGELVSLSAVEEALEDHPGVESAIAAAIDHPSLGTDVVVGFVSANGNAVGVGELRAFLAERMGTIHGPTRILRLDALPLSSSTKPSRAALAALMTAERSPPSRAATPLSPDRVPELLGVEVRMAALWCEILSVNVALGSDADFFALGADSLHLVELCTAIDREFGYEVMPTELIERPRLGEMAALVRGGSRRGPRPILVSIRPGAADRLPLYLVPGRGGTLAQAQRFVFQLAPGRPIYGFEPRGIYYGERPVKSVSGVARTYVDELLRHAGPDGRFAILGFSFGATVVQEMACRLDELGHPPTVIVMMDCMAPKLQKRRSRRRVRLLARWFREPSARFVRSNAADLRPRVDRMSLLWERAGRRHRARPTSAPTLMFTSEMNRSKTSDPLLGWSEYLLGPVTRLDYPGAHNQLTRTLAGETAPALDRVLAEYDAGTADST
jgi:thioesterase domain-containing protein/acyl carrier protein